MKKRYARNMQTLTPEENARLRAFRVCVIGCGGLGGYVIEYLGRLGIGRITAVDGDTFEETNLNRQILSDETVIGQSKAKTAKERMKKVNSEVEVFAVQAFLDEKNAEEIIKGHDVVVDALDNIDARLILEKACEKQGIPFIHGAIGGWYGQVSVVLPGTKTLEKLYPRNDAKGMEVTLGNPSFTPAIIAGIQASETLKLLLGKEGALAGKLLTIDLLSHDYEVFEI